MVKWEIKRIAETDTAALAKALSEGWEPFAAVWMTNSNATRIYLRRRNPPTVVVLDDNAY